MPRVISSTHPLILDPVQHRDRWQAKPQWGRICSVATVNSTSFKDTVTDYTSQS